MKAQYASQAPSNKVATGTAFDVKTSAAKYLIGPLSDLLIYSMFVCIFGLDQFNNVMPTGIKTVLR